MRRCAGTKRHMTGARTPKKTEFFEVRESSSRKTTREAKARHAALCWHKIVRKRKEGKIWIEMNMKK